ncbi:MAG TPA: hypothetical protein ENI53_00845 [Thermoplasmatales archaeon]|nr:hypothetical protein [Thermoplasmatales archaeon]
MSYKKKLLLILLIAIVISVDIPITRARYDPDSNDGDLQPNNDGEYYFAYGDSITRAVQGDLSPDGMDCYIHQMNETYDPLNTADNNMDGGGKTSFWGLDNFASHYNPSNTYFFIFFGRNDLRDADGVSETKEQYASNMLEMYNRSVENGSITYLLLPLISLTEGYSSSPRVVTHDMEIEWITYAQQQYEKFDVKYIKLYDAIDSDPWNGRIDTHNSSYFTTDGVHPNLSGHQAMAEFIWYFVSGQDYNETYYATNNTIVIDANYNETIYVSRRDNWSWNHIKVYCITNSTYVNWTQGYNNTIHIQIKKGYRYKVYCEKNFYPFLRGIENHSWSSNPAINTTAPTFSWDWGNITNPVSYKLWVYSIDGSFNYTVENISHSDFVVGDHIEYTWGTKGEPALPRGKEYRWRVKCVYIS